MSNLVRCCLWALLVVMLSRTPLPAAALDVIWQKESVSGISAQAAVLTHQLETHLDEMLDSGHLQPAYHSVGLAGEFLLYGYPAETVYLLSDLLPLVSPEMQARIRSYLSGFMTAYPPLQKNFLHGSDGWGLESLALLTPRREYYPMPPDKSVNIWPPPTVPFEALYMIWRYADATGDWEYLQSAANWNALQTLYATYDSAERYGQIAGLIGAARIAAYFNDTVWRDDAVGKAVAAISAADYGTLLAAAQTAFRRPTHDWVYPPFHYARAGVPVGVLFAPEIGRIISEHDRDIVRESLDHLVGERWQNHAQASCPGWFVYRADHCYEEYISKTTPWMTPGNAAIQEQGGENSYAAPDFAWTLFHLRAAVLGDNASALMQMVDQPTCIGDLYYLQKLATAIRAFGVRVWQDVRSDPFPPSPKRLRASE